MNDFISFEKTIARWSPLPKKKKKEMKIERDARAHRMIDAKRAIGWSA